MRTRRLLVYWIVAMMVLGVLPLTAAAEPNEYHVHIKYVEGTSTVREENIKTTAKGLNEIIVHAGAYMPAGYELLDETKETIIIPITPITNDVNFFVTFEVVRRGNPVQPPEGPAPDPDEPENPDATEPPEGPAPDPDEPENPDSTEPPEGPAPVPPIPPQVVVPAPTPETIEIPEEEIPTTQPEEEEEVDFEEEEEFEDEEIPTDVPQTGDSSPLHVVFALISLAGAAFVLTLKRSGNNG